MEAFDSNFINKVDKLLKKQVVDRMDKIAIQAHNRLSIRTPKDTGQAHAGWNFTLNRKDTTIPTKPPKGAQRLSPQLSVPDKFATKPKDTYHLVNAVSHIIFLNEGSSEQAPTNFVEIEVFQAVKDVERSEI